MLKIDASLNHIAVRREHVVTLLESANSPLVNIPSFGTAAPMAFVAGTTNDRGTFRVFVYLAQPDNNNAVTIYVSEPRELTMAQYRVEESEAVRFLESMGFMMESRNFRALAAEAQEAEMRRVGLFEPPGVRSSIVDLIEAVHEEALGAAAENPPDGGAAEIFGGLSREKTAAFRRKLSSASRSSSQAHPTQPAHGAHRPTHHDVPSGQPATPATSAPSADVEALVRLGRFLSTFGFFAVVAGAAGCATTQAAKDEEEPLDRETQTQIDIGIQHMSDGDWPQAIAVFQPIVEKSPKARDALNGLGLAYMNLGRPEEAEGYLRRAADVDPEWSEPKNTLATLLILSHRCAEAQALLEKVLKDIFYRTPEYAEHNLARALACQGKTTDAINRLESLILKRPKFCLGYLTLAELAQADRRSETAIKTCEAFTRECEKHEEIGKLVSPELSCMCLLNKGLAFAQLGDVEAARQSFESCRSEGTYGKECRRSLEMLGP